MYLRQLFFFICYHFTIMITHLLLISVIAFFHFLLGHKLAVIEEWIYDHGWNIVIMSKLISTWLVFKFIILKSDFRTSFGSMLRGRLLVPSKEVIVVCIFAFIFLVFQGSPKVIVHNDFRIWKILMAFIGHIVFYLSDMVIIVLLQKHYPLDKIRLNLRLLTFPLLFVLFSRISFIYASQMGIMIFFYFYFILYLIRVNENNYSNILCFIVPMSCLGVVCGLDPVWGDSFSFVSMKNNPGILHLSVMVFMAMAYITLKRSRYHLIIRNRILGMTGQKTRRVF
ncbi:MAG: hypothetical protein KAQ98_03210 [Bacteriovoracaceae bacterium]|nr:hypothetical protein [Bacteriovoracaceae bacterium]